jgi:hypothetical protein
MLGTHQVVSAEGEKSTVSTYVRTIDVMQGNLKPHTIAPSNDTRLVVLAAFLLSGEIPARTDSEYTSAHSSVLSLSSSLADGRYHIFAIRFIWSTPPCSG